MTSATLTLYRPGPDGYEQEVPVQVTGVYVPAVRGGPYEPPAGEGYEDVRAYLADGTEVALTEDEEEMAQAALLGRRDDDYPEPDDGFVAEVL